MESDYVRALTSASGPLSERPAAAYRIVLAAATDDTRWIPLARALDDAARGVGLPTGTLNTHLVADPSRAGQLLDSATAVVAFLGTADSAWSAAIDAIAGVARHGLVPVFPVYDPSVPYATQATESLSALNGIPWPRSDPADLVAATILRCVGITEPDRRVFVSYRRTDGSELANQLRYGLADNGWEVFLDRFNIPPGVDFQNVLEDELADKAFALIVESPDSRHSRWVEHEVAYALRRKLGLVAITLPTTRPHQELRAIPDDLRIRLHDAHVEQRSGQLVANNDAVSFILALIDRHHAEAFALRRESILNDCLHELSDRGYDVHRTDPWTLTADRGHLREILLVGGRAPKPSDIRAADEARRSHTRPGAKTRCWLVHPGDDNTAQCSLVKWLCRRRLTQPVPVLGLGERL